MGEKRKCILSKRNTYRWKLKVLLVDKVEDVFDPMPVVWTSQLHWWCQCAHSQYYGLLHMQKMEVMQKYWTVFLFVCQTIDTPVWTQYRTNAKTFFKGLKLALEPSTVCNIRAKCPLCQYGPLLLVKRDCFIYHYRKGLHKHHYLPQ